MSALLTKLRKAQDLLVARCVPKNLHYKPSGVQSAASAPAGANYHLIYPSYESRLDVSEQLYADFWIMRSLRRVRSVPITIWLRSPMVVCTLRVWLLSR